MFDARLYELRLDGLELVGRYEAQAVSCQAQAIRFDDLGIKFAALGEHDQAADCAAEADLAWERFWSCHDQIAQVLDLVA